MRLAGLMVLFLVFAIAVFLNEDVLAGEGRWHINDRETQLVFAVGMVALVVWLLPGALLDLLDERPAVRLDHDGGEVRATVRRRRFRWADVVAIGGAPWGLNVRLARGRPIRIAGEFEGHARGDIHAFALACWTSAIQGSEAV
jgi:hypothetical protein